MRTHTKLLVVALAAAFTLVAAVSTASAGRLSIDDLDFYAIWDGADKLTFTAGGATVSCDVTLLGSFHRRTIQKVIRSLIGVVEHARIGDCDNGTVIIDTPPAWHITYEGFSGTLPRIESIRLLLRKQRFTMNRTEFPIAICLSQVERNAAGRASVSEIGQVTRFTAEASPAIDVDDVGISTLCDVGGVATLSGAGNVTGLDTVLLFVSLI